MKFCRSCGARIEFAVTEKGKRMPLDHQPDPNGKLVWDRLAGTVRYYSDVISLGPNEVRMTSHFASCPDADRHRSRRHRRESQAA